MRVIKKNSTLFTVFAIVFILTISFPTSVFADWAYADVDLTVDLNIINYKNCSTAYAAGSDGTDSDVKGYDGPAVCDPWVSAERLGAYGMGANFFPRDSYFGEYGTDASVVAPAGSAAEAKLKTDAYSGILEQDYQLDFQIDYEHDVFGADSWVIFYISLWSGMDENGGVPMQNLLLEEKDGWEYYDIRTIDDEEFWVLAKSYTFDSVDFETTIWPEIDLLAGSGYGVYAGVSSIVNTEDFSPIHAGAVPEPATLLLMGLGGLMLRRKR